MEPHGDHRHRVKIGAREGSPAPNRGIEPFGRKGISAKKGHHMWIRWLVRLCVAALIAIQTCIIVLSAAASAAPVRPGSTVEEDVVEARPPIIRTYALEGVIRIARWYTGAAEQPKVDLSRAMPRGTMRVSHTFAMDRLTSAGLRWKSSGNCTDKNNRTCTSLQSVRSATVAGAIDLKRASGCKIMVTGGTEAGHAPGRYSHGAGYKLDISHNKCIDRYITETYPSAGVRSDGATLYRSETGTVFASESDHWDILFP
ncbi:hypothetical protein [Nonomuraea sp. NPDC003804]|uniref:hypothetical protein n=1 Tax=Nonomuraea sp. NPDC003804 TaxID=3154547 RepID=UPI0033A52542